MTLSADICIDSKSLISTDAICTIFVGNHQVENIAVLTITIKTIDSNRNGISKAASYAATPIINCGIDAACAIGTRKILDEEITG